LKTTTRGFHGNPFRCPRPGLPGSAVLIACLARRRRVPGRRGGGVVTASRSMSPAKRAHSQQLDYQPPDSPRWEFGGGVHQGEVTAQLNFLARRARSRYCRQPRPIEPPIPLEDWNFAAHVAADEREFRRRQREDPRLAFVPASSLVGPPLNLADFM
jgi:hypothetical protein